MIKANIQELKSNFPAFIKKLEEGVSITLCYRNREIATITPKQSEVKRKRAPLGAFKHYIKHFDAEKFNNTDPELIEEFYKPIELDPKKY